MNYRTFAILTPSRTIPTPEYDFALAHNSPEHVRLTIVGKPVDEARNELVRRVLELRPRPEYVVWIDDDACWMSGTIERLLSDLSFRGRLDCVSGLACSRAPYQLPMAYLKTQIGLSQIDVPPQSATPMLGEVFAIGLHMLAHRTELLEALPVEPFAIREGWAASEDLTFCNHVRAVGGRIWLDSTLAVLHCDGEYCYLPGSPPYCFSDNRLTVVESIRELPRSRTYGPAFDNRRDYKCEAADFERTRQLAIDRGLLRGLSPLH